MAAMIDRAAVLSRLLAALGTALRRAPGPPEAAADIAALSAVVDDLAARAPRPANRPCRLPVGDCLDDALAATGPALEAVAAALRALASELSWVQNPNYLAAPPSPNFLAGYGYAELVGHADPATRMIVDRRALIGFLLFAPGASYPSHRHPAREIYLPLTPAAFWRDGEGWRERLPGELVYHPPNLAHAMRAGAVPLLAAYFWRGELATAARLT
jgi:hypothetical protein